MPTPLFLLLLAGGGFVLYRHLNPARPVRTPLRRTVGGRSYLLYPGVSFTDVVSASDGVTLLTRYQTDTSRVLMRAPGSAADQAIADLGLTPA